MVQSNESNSSVKMWELVELHVPDFVGFGNIYVNPWVNENFNIAKLLCVYIFLNPFSANVPVPKIHAWSYIVCQVLKLFLIKKYKIQLTSFFISICFILALTPADIIFYNFLESYSRVFEKKIFFIEFPFLIDSLPCPLPPSSFSPLTAKIR